MGYSENPSYAEGRGGIFLTDLQEIGRNLVLLRKGQGFTQEELAFQASRSVNSLQSIEYGRNNATVDTLILLAKVLRIDSRVLGVFSRMDDDILSELRQPPWLPAKDGGALQICENIVLLRKKRGMTQKELAHIAGVSTPWLRAIERGCANMTINKLLCIAKAFDLSLMKLTYLAMNEEKLMELVLKARARAGIG